MALPTEVLVWVSGKGELGGLDPGVKEVETH